MIIIVCAGRMSTEEVLTHTLYIIIMVSTVPVPLTYANYWANTIITNIKMNMMILLQLITLSKNYFTHETIHSEKYRIKKIINDDTVWYRTAYM